MRHVFENDRAPSGRAAHLFCAQHKREHHSRANRHSPPLPTLFADEREGLGLGQVGQVGAAAELNGVVPAVGLMGLRE